MSTEVVLQEWFDEPTSERLQIVLDTNRHIALRTGKAPGPFKGIAQRSDTITVTGSTTLTIAHHGSEIVCNSASPLTLTIATDAAGGFSGGEWISVYNAGAGTVTIAGDTGVTLRNAATVAQYKATIIDRRGANEWAQP